MVPLKPWMNIFILALKENVLFDPITHKTYASIIILVMAL